MNLKCLVSLSGIASGAAIFLPTCVPAEDTGSGGWDWSAEAYFWGADLGGETTSGSDVSLSIDDILDNLKFAVLAGVGAARGNWALFADTLYIDIGASESATATSGRLCCINHLRDSLFESRVVAGGHEQLVPHEV